MDLARRPSAFRLLGAFVFEFFFQHSVFLFFFAREPSVDTDKTTGAQSHFTRLLSLPFTLRTRALCLSSVRGLPLSRQRLGERRRRRTPVPRSRPGSGHQFHWQLPTCMYQLLLSLSFQVLIVIPLIMKAALLILFQTSLVGTVFEYSEEGPQISDLVVRFCKDVQKRSQEGYINFGRYVSSRAFITGSEPIDYIQKLHNGDLVRCETTFEMMGRTAQVNIICGSCSNKACKDERGCICGISYHERMCRVIVELAIPCAKSGPRLFKGFTVGFYPRSSEIVYNGFTQLGFEQLHHEFSFQTEQIHVSMYLSAMSSLSGLLGKPVFKVNPMKGLEVTLAGSGFSGAMPTTLSPTVLNVDWRCEIARSSPYEVHVLIPVEGYDPIEFTLTKTCG
ncbi:hypothetical protein U9M48_020272 [Paspalum notatum var. saurae]|uniref:Uncharacterized protein n=1 Tax=Paspalum notatum var. saurae TaxID=547442 RepID=A0AAQ3WSF3_PASNO